MKAAAVQGSAADILKRRGIKTVVYFHTDHFEPWRLIPGRTTSIVESVPDVEHFADPSYTHEFGRRATLFYKYNLNFLADRCRDLLRADPDDALGFVPPLPAEQTASRDILAALIGAGMEIQFHVHHENYTWNDRIRVKGTAAHLAEPEHRRFDAQRLELSIRLGLDMLRADGGLALDRWFFVHGNWALNASDPHECTVVREIEILRRNGCLGDFTQPSGREHTNSRIDEPYLARPVARAKGYDRPEADPIPAAGAGAVPEDRFLIWASKVNAKRSSIDHYSPQVRARMAKPGAFALAQAREAFAHDGVLYVKTHAHSMHEAYWADGANRTWPHASEGIIAELGTLFDGAAEAGAEVKFLTTSEVFDLLMAAPPPPPHDLLGVVADGDPMAAIGCDVVFRDATGSIYAPPPLGWLNPRVPSPRAVQGGADRADLPMPPVPDIIMLAAAPNPPPAQEREPEPAAERTVLPEPPPAPELPAAVAPSPPASPEPPAAPAKPRPTERIAIPEYFRAEVATINALAPAIALGRRAMFGAGSGVTGFYVSRAESGPLLQSAEVAVAVLLERIFLDQRPRVVEIGCGLGLLSTLLAGRGWRATGIDRDTGRIATAAAIAAAVRSGEGGGLPSFATAAFPAWAGDRVDLSDAVALVTNLIGSATPVQQMEFIAGLARFGTVIVDLARFFTRREPGTQTDALVAMFRKAGFAAPQPGIDMGNDGHYVVFTGAQPTGWRAYVDRQLARFRR